MSKLGYTFYPLDWTSSEQVFQLNLEERGFYRELIDLAMLNDNETQIKTSVWARKFDSDINTLESILDVLETLKLIERSDLNKTLFIPSCESRLKFVRAGRKGGQNKPLPKQTTKQTTKPLPKQKKLNRIESKTNKEGVNFDSLLNIINLAGKRSFTVINEGLKKKYKKLLTDGYTKQQIVNAIENAHKDPFHKENKFKHLTLDYFSRSKTIDLHGFAEPKKAAPAPIKTSLYD